MQPKEPLPRTVAKIVAVHHRSGVEMLRKWRTAFWVFGGKWYSDARLLTVEALLELNVYEYIGVNFFSMSPNASRYLSVTCKSTIPVKRTGNPMGHSCRNPRKDTKYVHSTYWQTCRNQYINTQYNSTLRSRTAFPIARTKITTPPSLSFHRSLLSISWSTDLHFE
jgi:hypothetical protein